MTGIIWRAVFTALAVAVIAFMAAFNGPVLPIWLVLASAVALIPLAIVDWWAVAIALVIHHRRPDVQEVLLELDHMVRTATGGTVVALLGVNFLIGSPLPRGSGFMLLVAALLLLSGRPIVFIFRFHSRK